jgi:quercetin dioxygenase-like cupin family protein
MQIVSGAGVFTPSEDPAKSAHYVEHLSVPDLSVGTYSITAGGTDGQGPHTEDEIYVVTAGRARLVTDSGEAEAVPGSVLFVPAGEVHRFVEISEDFATLVIFGPAEYSRR